MKGNISIKKIMKRYTQKILNEKKGIIIYTVPKDIKTDIKKTNLHYKVRLMPSGKQKDLKKLETLEIYEKEKNALLEIETTIIIIKNK